MTNIDYLCLLFSVYSNYLYEKRIYLNDETFNMLYDFFGYIEASDDMLDITTKMSDNNKNIKLSYLYKAYQLLKNKYKAKEVKKEESYLILDDKKRKKLNDLFNEDDVIKMNKLGWLLYNYVLENCRLGLENKYITIGPYDENCHKLSLSLKN
ncbi:MAG: hypothetical protein RSB71_01610 [Bacilli bacterium]